LKWWIWVRTLAALLRRNKPQRAAGLLAMLGLSCLSNHLHIGHGARDRNG
jgi:hypothetical protein